MPRLLTLAVLLGLVTAAAAADWPQFRGPNCSGRASTTAPLPAEIGPATNVVWKTPLPPGHSSPIVCGDRIYLTAVRDKKLLTIALDRANGKPLWEAAVPATTLEKVHKIGSHAQASPAADEERVVSFFGSYGLLCYDRDGRLVWQRRFGPFKNDFGAASSPIIYGDRVLLCQDHDQDSFLIALDKRTGETIWKTERSDFLRGFSTPVIWTAAGRPQVVVPGTLRVAGYDLDTGKDIWTVRGIARTICMTPVIGDNGWLYVGGWAAGGDAESPIHAEPFDAVVTRLDANKNGKLEASELKTGPIAERFSQVDFDKDGSITREEYERFSDLFEKGQNVVLAIRPGGQSDVTQTHVVWQHRKQVPFCASPLLHAGVLFTVKDGGYLSSLDARNGNLLRRDRLSGSGAYYSSPVLGDGKVYLLNERGRLTVVSAAREWQVLGNADFGEDTYATPAIVGGHIYLRTAGHLYCFALQAGK